MKLLIILSIVILNIYGFLLDFLTYKNRNEPIPEIVNDIYDEETYRKRNSYETENLKLSIYSSILLLMISILCLAFNLHSIVYDYLSKYISNGFILSSLMCIIVGSIGYICSLPFHYYSTFKIEAKYGFNKTTKKTFIGDKIKELLLLLIIGGGLFYLFDIIYNAVGDLVFIIFYFVLVAVSLIASLFGRYIMKIFNKFTPLEDGSLKDKIYEYSAKVNFSVKSIYIMNASKRSTKANAFFSGFGKTKSIVLYDTLISQCTDEEIVSILAHEAGHAKHKHILSGFLSSLLMISLLLGGAYFIVTKEVVSQAFGFSEVNLLFGIYIFFIAVGPVGVVLNLPLKAISRKHEYQADKFAAISYDKDAMISALKKLAKANYANLVPHKVVVKLTYSHPTVKQRIEYINSIEK